MPPHRPNIKGKKPGTENYKMYDFIYMKFKNRKHLSLG